MPDGTGRLGAGGGGDHRLGPALFLFAMTVFAFFTGILGVFQSANLLAPTMRGLLGQSPLLGAVETAHPEPGGNPALIGFVVALPMVVAGAALTVAKRRSRDRWLLAPVGIRRLQAAVWLLSLARTTVLLAAVVVGLAAAGVTAGLDVDHPTSRGGPMPLWWLGISLVVLCVGLTYPFVRWSYRRIAKLGMRAS